MTKLLVLFREYETSNYIRLNAASVRYTTRCDVVQWHIAAAPAIRQRQINCEAKGEIFSN